MFFFWFFLIFYVIFLFIFFFFFVWGSSLRTSVFLFNVGGVEVEFSFFFDLMSSGFFGRVCLVSSIVFFYSGFYISGLSETRRFL